MQTAALIAQQRLLRKFLSHSYEIKSESQHDLNYIVIEGKGAWRTHSTSSSSPSLPSAAKGNSSNKSETKVLVLAHGFGLGLGFYVGNQEFVDLKIRSGH